MAVHGGGGGGHGGGGFVQEDEILGKAYDAQLTRRLIGYLAPYKIWVIVALALLLAMSLAQIAPPIIAKYIVDQAVIPAVNGDLGRDEAFGRLALLGVLYLLVLGAGAGLRFAQTLLTTWVGQRAMYDLRLELLTFVSLPILTAITAYFRGMMRESFRSIRIRLARVNVYLNETLSGMAIVQLFTREKQTFDQFDVLNRDLLHANQGQVRAMS